MPSRRPDDLAMPPMPEVVGSADRIASHRDALIAYARSRGWAAAEAEDAVHETVLRALASRDPIARERAWLFTTLRRILIDRARSAGREVLDPRAIEAIESPAPARDPSGCACVPRLRAALDPAQLSLLEQVHLDDRSLGEVARELGITANDVGVRLHRARRALRDRIREACGVETLAEALECECASASCR